MSLTTEHYARRVRQVLLVTLLLNLTVVVAKLIAGFLAGSLSVISDGLHSSADSLNNIVGLFVIRLASKEPDDEHPFGHHKYETLAAFCIAGFLLVTAFELAMRAARRLFGEAEVEIEVTALTIGVMICTLAVNIVVWSYERALGRKLRSSFLLADASHTLSDIFVSSSVLVGLFFVRVGHVALDPILAFVIAAVITVAAYRIFASTIPVLVDSAPLPRERVAEIVRNTPGVESVHDIRSRGVPGMIFITLHLIVTPQDMEQAHAVTEEVERRLENAIGACQVNIHVEPRDH